MRLYWGDLHNHCGISYGHGSLEAALRRARQQLDFCSVTGHAFWPDMPADRCRYAEIIDYHTAGFQRLAGQWDEVLSTFETHNAPGEFVTFPSYEWHSLAEGDQVVLLREARGPLVSGESVAALSAALGEREHLIYPHHIGYPRGFRGINWDAFDGARSPLVEIYSMHGCSESDEAPFPMLHTMGPRDHDSTAQAGLALGHRFGFAAGTDHHSAYPGSWGDGRLAVLSDGLTRDALFEAFRARRVYAVSGDKLEIAVTLNDAPFGAEIRAPGVRRLHWDLRAADFVDTVELLKNNHVVRVWNGPLDPPAPLTDPVRARLRVEWGWGSKEEPVAWTGALRLSDGRLLNIETCFSGAPILAPTAGHVEETVLPHALIAQDDRGCAWRSSILGNPTTRHSVTQSLLLTVEMRRQDRLEFKVNGLAGSHSLEELLAGARAHFVRGWLSEAIRLGRAVPRSCYELSGDYQDQADGAGEDFYYLRVRQRNGQCAWVSPIWAEG